MVVRMPVVLLLLATIETPGSAARGERNAADLQRVFFVPPERWRRIHRPATCFPGNDRSDGIPA